MIINGRDYTDNHLADFVIATVDLFHDEGICDIDEGICDIVLTCVINVIRAIWYKNQFVFGGYEERNLQIVWCYFGYSLSIWGSWHASSHLWNKS